MQKYLKLGSLPPQPPQKRDKTNRVKPKARNFTSRQPRKLKFGIKAYFNPTRRNIKKKLGSPPHNRVKPKNSSSTSRQPRKLKFGMQVSFKPTRRNIKKRIGVTWHIWHIWHHMTHKTSIYDISQCCQYWCLKKRLDHSNHTCGSDFC